MRENPGNGRWLKRMNAGEPAPLVFPVGEAPGEKKETGIAYRGCQPTHTRGEKMTTESKEDILTQDRN